MISVIIPVYKNIDLFLKNLRDNLNFLEDCQVIVVNDDPSKSLEKDFTQFKKIILLENKKNLGFGQSVNLGVKKATGRFLFLLNSDVILEDKSYLNALNYFNDKKVFAISFAQKEKDGSVVGKNKIYWQRGLYHHQKAEDLKFGNNGWAEGGASIIDKDKFLKLGGFDPIYSPFYWEDIDLSNRARKAGWRILFDPKILVTHHHESTIGKYYDKKQIKIIAYRNQLIFTWKNLSTAKLILEHLFFLPILIINHLIRGDYLLLVAFIKALAKLPQIKK